MNILGVGWGQRVAIPHAARTFRSLGCAGCAQTEPLLTGLCAVACHQLTLPPCCRLSSCCCPPEEL